MNINKKCQVFTPEENVHQLLDSIGYSTELYGKKVVENSCGDGNILSEIVSRYINDCIRMKMPLGKIREGLQHDVFGVEIDGLHRDNCVKKLEEVANKYGVYGVRWNVLHGDFLKQKCHGEYDFVIGNPPYIAHVELSVEVREFLVENFSVCSHGKFDYCYAFIQAGIDALALNGKLAYLIPGSIFKNQYANSLRELLLPHLTDIYDYTFLKLFNAKLTTSAIVVYDKTSNEENVTYHDIVNSVARKIGKEKLTHKWMFDEIKDIENTKSSLKFGDFFHASSCIATQLNKAFIVNKYVSNQDYISVEGSRIEKSILRKAVSPRSQTYLKEELIIFPYYYEDDKLKRYSVEEFEKMFPFANQYLEKFRDDLKKRDSDKNANWFEYGRSQALAHLNQKKLLTSTLVTNTVKTYLLDNNDIPTSGIYIVTKKNVELETAKRILENAKFLDYVKNIGVISNGRSLRISPKDVNNYRFEKEEL